MKRIAEREKMSLAQCKKILNKDGCRYTDEEIIKIRDWIYAVSELTLSFLESRTSEEILRIEKILTSTDFKNETGEEKRTETED
jgi:hypothetical protein